MGKFALTIICLLCLTSTAFAASCKSLKGFQTDVHIDLQIPPPTLDQSKTRRELNKDQDAQHKEWLKKNGMESIWNSRNMETAGLAAGGWGMMSAYSLRGKPHDRYGFEQCPYFQDIKLAMMYRTIISIPKEFEKGSCAYKIILVHEMKHHNTNAEIARKTVAKFQEDLPLIISTIENAVPWIDHRTIQTHSEHMKAEFQDALTVYLMHAMQSEMEKQNSLVDSPEEYKRGSKLLAECGVRKP